jgi:hypothetical protein
MNSFEISLAQRLISKEANRKVVNGRIEKETVPKGFLSRDDHHSNRSTSRRKPMTTSTELKGIMLSDVCKGIMLSDVCKGIMLSDVCKGIMLSDVCKGIMLSD